MTKRLLMTASTFSHIINFHLPYLEQFQRLGWETYVACGGEPVDIPFAERVYALELKKSFFSVGNLRASKRVRQIIKSEDISLVITHTTLAACFTRLAMLGDSRRPRVINVVHGFLFDDSTGAFKALVLKSVERLLSGVTDMVLTMNRYDLHWASSNRAGSTVHYIPGMGVDEGRLEGRSKRGEYGFTEQDYVLIYAAEFSKRKNQSTAIRALTLLPDRVKLLLPGDGELIDDCRALARRLGVSGRVVFPGQISDIGDALFSADAAVSTSRSEGLPFNILEAMLCGLPVVASRVKGHVDLLQEGTTGMLFPYGDEKSLADCVKRLLDDPTLGVSMAERARDSASAYTLPSILTQVMREYVSVPRMSAVRQKVRGEHVEEKKKTGASRPLGQKEP